MKKRLHCYVRPQRRRWGFTQKEIAFIVGIKSRTAISRLERGGCAPSLMAAFALHVVFGTMPAELFPAIFAEVERGVLERAYDLYERLQGGTSIQTRLKLDFLEDIFERGKARQGDDQQI